jgi:large subunit ribosomal protein L2
VHHSLILAANGRQLFQQVKGIGSVGDFNSGSVRSTIQPGDKAPLAAFEPGDLLHSIQLSPSTKPLYGRAAGTFCQLISRDRLNQSASAIVRLPSGQLRSFPLTALASKGVVAVEENPTRARGRGSGKGLRGAGLAKAGRSR